MPNRRRKMPIVLAPESRSVLRRSSRAQPLEQADPPESRLEAEFVEALNSARGYTTDPERLRQLATEVTQKFVLLPQDTFKGTLVYLRAMLRLIRAYYRGEYRTVPITTLLIIVAALIYLLDPLDLLPDWIPALGFIDDAFILTLAIRRTREAIEQFLAWESRRT
jgi:uncharacterized membrane protein YkvA (DUF1232 family)